jgi:hypothetical protein
LNIIGAIGETTMEPNQEQLNEEILFYSEDKKKKIETIRKNFLRWKELRENNIQTINEPTYQELEGF